MMAKEKYLMKTEENIQKDEKKKDYQKESALTKVVLRRLPPTLTPEIFLEQVSPLPSYDFFYFVKADKSLGSNAYTRAYINFLNPEDVYMLRDKFDNYVFLDSKGDEYPAIVEFSPFQKVPKKKTKKLDSRKGTIEQDSDYQKFVESINNPDVEALPTIDVLIEEIEQKEKEMKANNGALKVTTPLIEYIKKKKEERKMAYQKKIEERKKREIERRKQRDEERRRRREKEREREKREQDRERGNDKDKDSSSKKDDLVKLLKNPERETDETDDKDREKLRFSKENRERARNEKYNSSKTSRDGWGKSKTEEYGDKSRSDKAGERLKEVKDGKDQSYSAKDKSPDRERKDDRADKLKDRAFNKDHSKSYSKDKDYGKNGDKDCGRNRDKDYGRGKDKGSGREKDKGYVKDRDLDRDYVGDRAYRRDRDHDYGRDRDSGKGYGRDQDYVKDKDRDCRRDKGRDSVRKDSGKDKSGKDSDSNRENGGRSYCKDRDRYREDRDRSNRDKDKSKLTDKSSSDKKDEGRTSKIQVKENESKKDSESKSNDKEYAKDSDISEDKRRKRKDRPERQIYVPRRALEKQKQDSTDSQSEDKVVKVQEVKEKLRDGRNKEE